MHLECYSLNKNTLRLRRSICIWNENVSFGYNLYGHHFDDHKPLLSLLYEHHDVLSTYYFNLNSKMSAHTLSHCMHKSTDELAWRLQLTTYVTLHELENFLHSRLFICIWHSAINLCILITNTNTLLYFLSFIIPCILFKHYNYNSNNDVIYKQIE